MKYDVFISYSRKDTKIADEVCDALTLSGLRCFIDREGIDGGANFPEVLANMIDDSGVFLLLASKNSYQSKFTQAEILHAFKHKRSGCIIPYLIDDSHMPSDLEFLLGNVNWVDSREHPAKDLPDIVKKALQNPNQGTVGGRKVRRKWYAWLALPLLALAIAGVALVLGNDMKAKKEQNTAKAHREAYLSCAAMADSLVKAAAVMGSSEMAIESTAEQIACLQKAQEQLGRCDSLKAIHSADGFASLFPDKSALRTSISSRLDSIYTAWSEYARQSYQLWRVTRSGSEAANALECINYALSIKPDAGLETIKSELRAK